MGHVFDRIACDTAAGPMGGDARMAADTFRVCRTNDVGFAATMIAMTGGASVNFIGLGIAVMRWRGVASEALLVRFRAPRFRRG